MLFINPTVIASVVRQKKLYADTSTSLGLPLRHVLYVTAFIFVDLFSGFKSSEIVTQHPTPNALC